MTTAPLRLPSKPAQAPVLCEPLQFPVVSSTGEPIPFRPASKPRRDDTFMAALIHCAEEYTQKQRATDEERRREAAEQERLEAEQHRLHEAEDQRRREEDERQRWEDEERQRHEDEELIRRAAAEERRRLEAEARERQSAREPKLTAAVDATREAVQIEARDEVENLREEKPGTDRYVEERTLCESEEQTRPDDLPEQQDETARFEQNRMQEEDQLRLIAEEHRIWEEKQGEKRETLARQSREHQRILAEEECAWREQSRCRAAERRRLAADEHWAWEEEQSREENIPARALPLPGAELPQEVSMSAAALKPAHPGLLGRAWLWLNRKCVFSPAKHLRVAETVSLGEKRFVAVVQVGGRKFLIGGGAAGVAMLTPLGETAHAGSGFPAEFVEGQG